MMQWILLLLAALLQLAGYHYRNDRGGTGYV